MSKLHKILISVFCCGVLLCGLGAGLAFIEFTELSYGGTQYLGKTDMRTDDIDVEFEPGEEQKSITGLYLYQWGYDGLITDKDVPKNTVRLRVTYNAERIEPRAFVNEETDQIVFMCYHKEQDEIALMMEAKDVFLQNLKAGSIVSLDTLGIEEISVRVNPANVDDVRPGY